MSVKLDLQLIDRKPRKQTNRRTGMRWIFDLQKKTCSLASLLSRILQCRVDNQSILTCVLMDRAKLFCYNLDQDFPSHFTPFLSSSNHLIITDYKISFSRSKFPFLLFLFTFCLQYNLLLIFLRRFPTHVCIMCLFAACWTGTRKCRKVHGHPITLTTFRIGETCSKTMPTISKFSVYANFKMS